MTSDELALLAEGNAGEAAEGLQRHLAHCRSCYQAYEDAVEARARWLAGEESHAAPELIRAGRAIGVGRESGGRVTGTSWLRLAATTVGVLGLVVAGWLYLAWQQTNSVLGRDDIAKLEPLAEKASANSLIIPGYPGPASHVINAPADRSATASFSQEVQPVVDRLRAAHDQDMAPDDLFWLITVELASGDLVMARHYLRGALPKDDLRFRKLEAILAYRENQVGEAEDILRAVLGQAPGDNEAMFNLGQVLIETGRGDEGKALLLSVQDTPDSVIANRARAALDSMSARQSQP